MGYVQKVALMNKELKFVECIKIRKIIQKYILKMCKNVIPGNTCNTLMFYLKPETPPTPGACSVTVSWNHTDRFSKHSPGFLAVEMEDFVCRACLTGLFFLIPLGDAALPFPSCNVSKALLAWTVNKEIINNLKIIYMTIIQASLRVCSF